VVLGNKDKSRKMAINDALPLKAARRDAIANLPRNFKGLL